MLFVSIHSCHHRHSSVKPLDQFHSVCVCLLLLSMGSGQSKDKLHCNRYLDKNGPPPLEQQGTSQTYTPNAQCLSSLPSSLLLVAAVLVEVVDVSAYFWIIWIKMVCFMCSEGRGEWGTQSNKCPAPWTDDLGGSPQRPAWIPSWQHPADDLHFPGWRTDSKLG